MISLQKVLDSVLCLAFPQPCHVCGGEVDGLSYGVSCSNCWAETRLFDSGTLTSCYKCSYFFGEGGESKRQFYCSFCSEDTFDLVRCVGLYEKALMKTVLHLKNVPFVPKYLQELIVKTFQLAPFEKVDLIVPVPISKVRLSERGFNQASLLAKPLSKMTKIKLDETALIRHIHTKRHSPGMDKKARQMSVKQAFSVASPEKVKGRNILLIDDVFTSGATASNCAIALKEKGALKVYVLAVARAFII